QAFGRTSNREAVYGGARVLALGLVEHPARAMAALSAVAPDVRPAPAGWPGDPPRHRPGLHRGIARVRAVERPRRAARPAAAVGGAAFRSRRSVERIWGVGKVMARELAAHGITSVAQLQAVPAPVLAQRFGSHGQALHDLAFGRDERPVEPWTAPKSMGAENT